MDMILTKKGSIKPIPKNKNKIKKNSIKCILLECDNPIIGRFYYAIEYKYYRKLSRLKNIKFKYKFLDGYYVYEEDTNLYYTYQYQYNKVNDFISKIVEIMIAELVLNDAFWLQSSELCYNFTDLKVKYKDSRLKKKKTISYYSFEKNFLTGKKKIFKDDFITLDGRTMAQILDGIFIEVNPSLFNIKYMTCKQKIYLNNFYYGEDGYIKYSDHSYEFKPKNIESILGLFIFIASKEIIERLETDILHENLYDVKLLFYEKKKNNSPKRIKGKKFIRKYFKGVDI